MRQMLVGLLCLAASAVATRPGAAAPKASGLVLELSVPQTEVLVGEPVKVVLRLRATKDVPYVWVNDEELTVESLRFLVDYGGPVETYLEYQHNLEEPTHTITLRAGRERAINLVLARGGYLTSPQQEDPKYLFPPGPFKEVGLFPVPGHVRLTAVYRSPLYLVRSKPVVFDVRAPEGDDIEILKAVRMEPTLLAADFGTSQRAKELMALFPDSRYFTYARLGVLRQAKDQPLGMDQDERRRLRRASEDERERHVAAVYARTIDELLRRQDWGPFEEDALDLAIRLAEANRNDAKARELEATLFARFPNSVSVWRRTKAARDEPEERD